MSFQVRRGTEVPYSRKLPALAWATGPELFRFLYGDDPAAWERLFEAGWTSGEGLHCGPVTWLACSGEEIVGMVTCFPTTSFPELVQSTKRQMHEVFGEAVALRIGRAFAQVIPLFPPIPCDAFEVLNLAVAKKWRQNGVGRLLMSQAEHEARQHGLSSIHLDTSSTSGSAAFYQRIGFEPLTETRLLRPPACEAVPSHIRMVKSLAMESAT